MLAIQHCSDVSNDATKCKCPQQKTYTNLFLSALLTASFTELTCNF